MSVGDRVFYAVLLLVFLIGSAYALGKEGGLVTTNRDGVAAFEKARDELRAREARGEPVGSLQRAALVASWLREVPNWDAIGVLLATFLTLSLYSFLYKDNPFFKAAEHLYVGVTVGYELTVSWFNILKPNLYAPLFKYWVRPEVPGEPDYLLFIPLVLGLFLLARFIPSLAWLSRWAFAFVVGLGAGIAIPNTIHGLLLQQLGDTARPVVFTSAAWLPALNTLLILVGVISVLIYFFFSLEHRGVFGGISRLGVWFLMVSFGASFGYTVMGRMALFVERVDFLLLDWLKLNFQ